MPERPLRDCRILVVEDEYRLADELQTELGDVDAVVLGPVGSLDDALDLIGSGQHIDGAILDVNLRGEMARSRPAERARRAVPVHHRL